MAKTSAPETLDFEKALTELEKIVQRMEQGEQTLEATLKDFERGMVLSRLCQDRLKQAELRVEKLVKRGKDIATEAFEPEADK